jgi:uncharacterized protein CbrC (UPF0167 family)
MCTLTYACCELCRIVNSDTHSVEECYLTRHRQYAYTHCPYLLVKISDSICQWCFEDLPFTDC